MASPHFGKFKRIVLAVDDDPLILDLIDAYLWELDVRTSRRPAEAKRALETLRPDLILLDINMPECDGLDLLAWIRRRRDLDLTPVLMLTARADRRTVTEAMQAGADGYMIKPFTGLNLLRRAKIMTSRVRIAA